MRWISKCLVFIYIIVFSVVTDVTINRLCLLAMVAVCGVNWLATTKGKLSMNSFMVAVLVYGFFMVLSMAYSTAPSMRIQKLLIAYFSMAGTVFCMMVTTESKRDIDLYLNAFIFAAVFQLGYMLSVYGVDILSVVAESERGIRIGDEVSNSNTVGMSFAYGAIISFHYIRQKNIGRIRKFAYLFVIISAVVLALLSGSRKALLVLVLGIFVLFYFGGSSRQSMLNRIAAIIGASALILLMYWIMQNFDAFAVITRRIDGLIGGLAGEGELDHSSANRFAMIEKGFDVFMEHPILGEGVYASYNYFNAYAHNNFIEILMNTGMIGFAIHYLPYLQNGYALLVNRKTDERYGLMVFLCIWMFVCGFGMVTYFEKTPMCLFMILSSWIELEKRTKIA